MGVVQELELQSSMFVTKGLQSSEKKRVGKVNKQPAVFTATSEDTDCSIGISEVRVCGTMFI